MKITSIEKFKGSMYNVFIDGEYNCSLHIETIMENHLRANVEIDEGKFEEIKRACETRRARERALHLLDFRSHSRKELYDKLKKNYDEEICQTVVDRLTDAGLLNDSEYAERLVELCLNKHYGKMRIKAELKKRGIDNDTASEALENADIDPQEEIIKLIDRKYARYLNDEKGVTKTTNALVRMGYTFSQIREAISTYMDEYESEYSDDLDEDMYIQ